MSLDSLDKEQQAFFSELVGFDIPESIAVIIALKTNWAEIRRWDEHKELRLLATIIWQTGIIETMAESMKMARKIRNKCLDQLFLPKITKTRRKTKKKAQD